MINNRLKRKHKNFLRGQKRERQSQAAGGQLNQRAIAIDGRRSF